VPTVEELTRNSPLIFTGAVQRLNATTVEGLAADEHTVVVAVEELLRVPDAFAWLAGREVTVYLQEPESVQEGEGALFFTTSWLIGDSVAVRELGHERATDAIREEVAGLVAGLPDDEIAARARRADVIVAGRVTEVRAAADLEPDPSRAPSEHDPLWHEAELEVEAVAKGELPADRPVVLFPASEDVAWYASPKLESGQQAVFLLHRQDVPEAVRDRHEVFTALDPVDVRQPEEFRRVEELANR